MESIENQKGNQSNDETLFPGCRQFIQRDSLAYPTPQEISDNPRIVFSLLHHSTYLWLRDRPTPVDEEDAYSKSPFQRKEDARYYYKITIGIPDSLRPKLKLFTPYSSQPIRLTDQAFAGVYKGILIPEDVYEELLRNTIIYGRPIDEEELKLVFDGREKE